MEPECYGAVDLGTNNCRLLIARSLPIGFQVVDSYSQVVRLGAGLASTGRLSDANMDLALEAIDICAARMKAKRVKHRRCIATQACREAENGEEFLTRVKKETGLAFETISPRVEARLAAMGCLNIIDPEKHIALVIDIGGGSTELSWVDVRKLNSEEGSRLTHRPPISAWVSIPLGVVNLSEMYPEPDRDTSGWYETMKTRFRDEIEKSGCQKRFFNVFRHGHGHLVGTSGTITSLAGVHLCLPYYQRKKIDGIWMLASDLLDTARQLGTMSYEKRRARPCIGEERATMMVAGCAIFDVICDLWPSDRIRVADRGLREGMLMGLINKSQGRMKPKSNGQVNG